MNEKLDAFRCKKNLLKVQKISKGMFFLLMNNIIFVFY